MARAVRDARLWNVVQVHWPDEAALYAARALPASGYVLVGGGCPALAEALANRPLETPLVCVGAEVLSAAQPSAWLPSRTPAGVLTAVLRELIGEAAVNESAPPPSLSWRRKTDMIVGGSAPTQQLLLMLDRLAPSMAPVLVTGESGTGKELVARALHYCGPRAREPFVAINCAAIPETLFESELFGYQRGAFTGAVSMRPGAFESAHKGTLFLDELGEMPLPMQAKLLRVLETGEVTRLGGNEMRKVAVRLVAATNRRLEDDVRAGRFREDLYYRVRVYPVHVPPLRERPEDIPPIAQHYLSVIGAREQRGTPRLTPSALEKLLTHAWPGNVRELVNILERAALTAEDQVIDAQHIVLPYQSTAPPPLITAYKEAKARFETEYYEQLLRTAGGKVALAAKLAQKTRKEVYDALKRLGLDRGVFRTGEVADD